MARSFKGILSGKPEDKEDENADFATGKAVVDTTEKKDVQTPKNVISNGSGARIVYNKLRESHRKRSMIFGKIQGMIDGNPPYPKASLKRAGILAQSNVNWRDGEAIYESVALAFWSLFNDVQNLCEVGTTLGDPQQNPHWGRVMSEELDTIIRDWDQFASTMSEHQGDFVKYGVSFLFWQDEEDWRFQVADVWKFLIPERTRNHVSFFNIIAIERTMTAHELFDILEDYKGEKWDLDALKEIMWQAQTGQKEQYSTQLWASQQTKIRNGDTSIDELYSDDITFVSLFMKEYDGKVSHGMIHPTYMGSEDKWVFFHDRQYDQMSHAAALFTFTPAERFVHGNKGVGHKSFNTVEGVTQIDNSVMDSARRAATVLVRSRAGRNKDAKQVQFIHGGLVDIGEAEFVQNLMGANLQSSVEVARYFQDKLQMNNNISGTNMASRDGKPQTLGEVRVQATREARVQKNRIAHYYGQLDFLWAEVFRKMLRCKEGHPGYEEVALFKKRCIERGIPEEIFVLNDENMGQNGLPEHLSIKATRASGSGSQVADQIEMQAMMPLLPSVGEIGRENIMRDYIAANRGHRFIERYMPPNDREKQPLFDNTLASIENNQLEKGEMVVVSPDNNHAIHAPSHIQRLNQVAEAFNQAEEAARGAGSQQPSVDAGSYGQYSLEEVDVCFQTLGPHFVRHLLYLSQDPTRAAMAKQLNAQWAILANFGDKIANNAQEHRTKQMRDLQKGQQDLDKLDMEERVKMREVEVKGNVAMAKLRGEIANGAAREQLQYLVQRMRVSLEGDVKRAKAFNEMALDAARELRDASEETKAKGRNQLF